jgi:hypothetical protein
MIVPDWHHWSPSCSDIFWKATQLQRAPSCIMRMFDSSCSKLSTAFCSVVLPAACIVVLLPPRFKFNYCSQPSSSRPLSESRLLLTTSLNVQGLTHRHLFSAFGSTSHSSHTQNRMIPTFPEHRCPFTKCHGLAYTVGRCLA